MIGSVLQWFILVLIYVNHDEQWLIFVNKHGQCSRGQQWLMIPVPSFTLSPARGSRLCQLLPSMIRFIAIGGLLHIA